MKSKTIELRQDREKTMLLENLKRIPIIEIACKRANVGRATYYRWIKEDSNFAKETCKALREGADVINDLAESKLLQKVQADDLPAIMHWLRAHHRAYRPNFDIIARQEQAEEGQLDELTNLMKDFAERRVVREEPVKEGEKLYVENKVVDLEQYLKERNQFN